MRCAGCLVMRRGKTWVIRSFGSGFDERKILLAEGIDDELLNRDLYPEMLELACNGEM